MIGLIENSTANLLNTDMPGTSNEPNPEAPKLTPTVTEGTSSAVELSMVELKDREILLFE